MAKRWYVVHAYSGYEKHVMRALKSASRCTAWKTSSVRSWFPPKKWSKCVTAKSARASESSIPGYVLVQMEMDDASWHLVKNTPRVMGFIGGTPDKPAPITDREADAILRRVESGADKPKPKTLFEPGEIVRVTEGPFADFNGVVEEVDYEKSRVKVAVLIFGRSTPVELEFSQVEKD